MNKLTTEFSTKILGAISATEFLFIIATGNGSAIGNFADNGYGVNSPGHYSLLAALVTEIVMTFMFLIVILGATYEKAPKGFAGLAIGLALTLIHLINIHVNNISVNPARSIGQAIPVGRIPIEQLWLFIVAPIISANLVGVWCTSIYALKANVFYFGTV